MSKVITLNDYKNVSRKEIPKSLHGRATVTDEPETEYCRADRVKPMLDKAKSILDKQYAETKQDKMKIMALEDVIKKVADQRDFFKNKSEILEEENVNIKSKYKDTCSLDNHEINDVIDERKLIISRESKDFKELSDKYEKMYL
jgi:hypothetical protein